MNRDSLIFGRAAPTRRGDDFEDTVPNDLESPQPDFQDTEPYELRDELDEPAPAPRSDLGLGCGSLLFPADAHERANAFTNGSASAWLPANLKRQALGLEPLNG